jgi:hypothetical protein
VATRRGGRWRMTMKKRSRLQEVIGNQSLSRNRNQQGGDSSLDSRNLLPYNELESVYTG